MEQMMSTPSGFESYEAGDGHEEGVRSRREHLERRRRKDDRVTPRAGYLVELLGEAIPLELVEFRLLDFLSSQPYKAFTRRQIAEAISSPESRVSEDMIDGYVMSLRDKLGLFSDYVQSVPYVGYRFKE
jgi:DNA-binding response OmpR family regulator